MTSLVLDPTAAASPPVDAARAGSESGPRLDADGVLAALAALPLRERVAVLRGGSAALFESVNSPVIEWGGDPELAVDVSTVDGELGFLRAERGALVGVIEDVVAVTRSLDASVRVLVDQHARVVSRFDVLDADQLERRLSSPATALAGEFACDDFASLLGISSGAAARWAETGSVLRTRHPRLLRMAARGEVRMRACEVVVKELAHIDAEHVDVIEAQFLTGDVVHGSEASMRKQLRRLLDHRGLARPREEEDDAARIGMGFNEIPEQPTLTELNVILGADDAWRLNAAIESRARALIDEWTQARGPDDAAAYPIRRARVDALLDLALGHVRFVPDVRITVPVAVSAAPAALCDFSRGGSAGVDANVAAGRATTCSGDGNPVHRSATTLRIGGRGYRVGDVDVPRIGRVGADALTALGETLGARVTVALADADSGVTTWSSSTTYRPALSMRRFVETRDAHCRFPGCMRPAPMCDVDHVIAHAGGGATSPANLQLLCRHHHRAKTHGAWGIAMTPDGVCVWQSPVGDWFRTHPSDATAYRITPAEGLAIAADARPRRTCPAA